jgi:uncharacterized protein (DUF58 family)
MSDERGDPTRAGLREIDRLSRGRQLAPAPRPADPGRPVVPPPTTVVDQSHPFRWSWLGIALIVVGAFAGTPGLLLVGALLILSSLVRTLWSRYGLRHLHYERRLLRDRAALGEEIEMQVVAWNDKILPLAWLEADDLVSDGLTVRERPTVRSDRIGFSSLRSTWTLAPFERVTTHLHVGADRRGVYRFGPVRLGVADLFGRDVATRSDDLADTLLIRPRSVPVTLLTPELAPLGERRSRHGIHHDPALFAGVRPYQPTDPRRSVHWRATARMGQPVSKRFEPATSRRTLIALDVQTNEEPYWMMVYDEELLESLVVAAASLARFSLEDGGAVGMAANAWSGSMARTAFVAPAAGQHQLPLLLDALARLSVFASSPFEVLLSDLSARLTPGTSIVAITAHDPRPALGVLRRLASMGFPVTHVAFGPDREAWAEAVQRAGIEARTANLDQGWRASRTLELAG